MRYLACVCTSFSGFAPPSPHALRLASALSRYESEPRYRTGDYLAEYFLPWQYRVMLKWCPWYVKRRAASVVPAGLSWLIARTHIYDHALESALTLERDITQVVILGAGLDTRFSRLYFPSDRQMTLIEVDAPATQAYKRSIISVIASSTANRNSNIHYLPVDFERESIETALLRYQPYNPNAKTFFIWEAVTPYLTEEAVGSVLRFVKEHSAPGSTIAFDVRYKEALTGQKKYNMTPLAKTVGSLREPFKFGVPEGSTREWIHAKGFDVYAIYGPPQLAEYVTSDTSYSLDIPDIMDLVIAKTPRVPRD